MNTNIVEEILGKDEKDEKFSSISINEFKKSINDTLENLEKDLNDLKEKEAEMIIESLKDNFVIL